MSTLRGTMIKLSDFDAYLSRPDAGGQVRGGLVLNHEIWGLVDHIKDVADRFAGQGYVVIAPDLLSHVGIDSAAGDEIQRLMFSADEAERSKAQPSLRERLAPAHDPGFANWAVPALVSVVDRLATEPGVDGRIAAAGFCFGGTYTYALAAADPRVKAAVPFYGSPPQATDYAGFACRILAFYGAQDERLITGLPEVTAAMADAGVDYTSQVYPDTGHAFFNDTNTVTYNAADAADAWQRTLAFLADTLPSRS